MQNKLSTNPYKGARDFYPEDKRLLKYIFNHWRQVVESYGYEEYDAPILEDLAIYQAKSGQEIVNDQTYSFTDRGGRELAIRPEMTPSVSRMVARKFQQLTFPLRLYSIPNLWRYERQQKGRFREHWQLNVDLFGDQSQQADYEMIEIADQIFKSFGADTSMYQFKVNDRRLTDYILTDYLMLDEAQSYQIIKLIDRFHKYDLDDFIHQIDLLINDQQRQADLIEKLLKILQTNDPQSLPEELTKKELFQDFISLFQNLNKNIPNVIFDNSIVRGFDYYNGFVFEVFDVDPNNNRSMMGGGRYDNLVSLFGIDQLPMIGFGLGDATVHNFLLAHGLMPDLPPEMDLFYVNLDFDHYFERDILNQIRQAGVNVFEAQPNLKMADQIKKALKKNIPFFIVVGDQELKTKRFQLKDLRTSKVYDLSINELIQHIQKNNSKTLK